MQTAIIRATAENKRIIIDIGGEWCGWCIQMDNYFLQHKDLAKLRDKNFIWVKVNMSEGNENKEFLGKYPKISGHPHLYVLEKDGSVLHSQNTSDIEEPDLPIVVPSDVKDKTGFLEKRAGKTQTAKLRFDEIYRILETLDARPNHKINKTFVFG